MPIKREFAVVAGKIKEGVVLEKVDLVRIIAPNAPDIDGKICFFEGFLTDDVIELDTIGPLSRRLVSLKIVGCVEIIAKKNTIQHEIFAELLNQNYNLQARINQIEKNFAELLCK